MEKFAKLILGLFRMQRAGRQRTADSIVEDDRVNLKIVARLRTECDKFRSTEDVSRINDRAAYGSDPPETLFLGASGS
jgi:hypothetical protein